jgi:hypothetical protein
MYASTRDRRRVDAGHVFRGHVGGLQQRRFLGADQDVHATELRHDRGDPVVDGLL